MRVFSTLCLLCILASCGYAPRSEGLIRRAFVAKQAFIQGTEDIPLYRELDRIGEAERKEHGLSLSSYRYYPESWQPMLDFYHKTLPQLGWEVIETNRFRRDNEILSIDRIQKGNNHYVSFVIEATRGQN